MNVKYVSLKKFLTLVLCFVFIIIPFNGITSTIASNATRQTIRIGYFRYDGFYNQNNDGDKSGYGYDLLQKLRIYENWDYEYIGYDENTSWEDMFTLLENGDIDLLAPANYTKERCLKFDYSSLPIGSSSTVLSIKPNNRKYSTDNYSNWNNIKVGMIASNNKNNSFLEYAKKHGFTYKPVICKNTSELIEKLQSGEVDIIATSSLLKLSDVWIVDEFDESDAYCIVKKGNSKLLSELNDGITKLFVDEPNYQEVLFQKYFKNDNSNTIQFTEKEQIFIDNSIKSKNVFYAVINPNRKPLSYFNNGNMKGLLTDICKEIFSRTGLNIKILELDSREKYYEKVNNKSADIICDFTGNENKAEKNNLVLLDSYYTSTTSRLARRGFDGTGKRCAVAGSSISGWLQGQGYDFVYVNSVEECCDAVKKGDADFTFSYTKCIQDMVYDDETNSLMALSDNHQSSDFSIAVNSSKNALLCSILRKSIDSISSENISNIADAYTYYDQRKASIKTIMYRNPIVFGIFIFLFAALIFGIVILVIILRKKNTEARNSVILKKALTDSETATKEKNDFYSRMSHDMRTPMNGILGISQLSLDEDNTDILKDNMKKIHESGKYLLGLINDTLDLQKIESGKLTINPSVVSTREIIKSGTEAIKQMAKEKNIDFKITTENTNLDSYIRTDSMRIQQIFINLLSNAIKFTPNSGSVELKIKTLKRDKNMVYDQITVTDTGLGMSNEFLKDKIYQPFSQEHNSFTNTYAGSGLGLSIVKRLVDMLGAKISVESELGVGTKFTIDINIEVVDEYNFIKAIKSEQEYKNTSLKKLHGKQILLAEDHPLNAEIAKKLLAKVDCDVVWAQNGLECVNIFATSKPKQFDAIIMDIRMPVMDGIEASKCIRTSSHVNAKEIPIIAMTANAYESDIQACLEAGMNAHIAKPIEPQKFYKEIIYQLEKTNKE